MSWCLTVSEGSDTYHCLKGAPWHMFTVKNLRGIFFCKNKTFREVLPVRPSPRHLLDDFLEYLSSLLMTSCHVIPPFPICCLGNAESLPRKGMKVKLSKVFKSCSDAQSPGLWKRWKRGVGGVPDISCLALSTMLCELLLFEKWPHDFLKHEHHI